MKPPPLPLLGDLAIFGICAVQGEVIMAGRISVSQLKSKVRQAQAKQKKAIDDYYRAAREDNPKAKRAVGNNNQVVTTHNANVRANRQRLAREISRLGNTISPARLSRIRSSSEVLYHTFTRVEVRAELAAQSEHGDRFLDLSERETVNSLAVLNALTGQDSEPGEEGSGDLGDTAVTDELQTISPDLDKGWRGALYALDPSNPDAARHFCTSAREVFTRFLDLCAPDADVLTATPASARTSDGRPTRRERIKLLLARQKMSALEFEEFVEQDVENILDLFRVFDDGTDGSAGRLSLHQLRSVKKRVEDGILFLASLAG